MTFGVDGLTVRLASTEALSDVTVEIPRGEVTSVVGGDGAGKTTLLKALVGLVGHDNGAVHRPDADRLGYLPVGGGSWKSLTVDENVAFVGGAYGLTGDDLHRRANPLLEGAGLARVGDRLAGQLSGGMRTKLGFTLAMLHTPDLLVLDEPTTGVDPVSRVELWRMISQAVADGAAVVMSTVYLDEAERAASVVLLGGGRVLLKGRPDDLIAAIPGIVAEVHRPTNPSYAWRVGPVFHEWFPSSLPDSATVIRPNLEDACIVAELRTPTKIHGGTR